MPSKKWPIVLNAILDSYIHTGRPVGSAYLVEEYGLAISPATVRNIMADLTDEGFLLQPHTSAGRIPSAKAYRYYVRYLLDHEEQGLLSPEELQLRFSEPLNSAYEVLHFLSSALAQKTDLVGVAMMGNKFALSGLSNLITYRDTLDLEQLEQMQKTLEEMENLVTLFEQIHSQGIRFIIGEEIPLQGLRHCSIGVAKCQIGSWPTYMGVVGPMRMNYTTTYRMLNYLSGLSY